MSNPNLNGSGLQAAGLSTGSITVGTGATTLLTVTAAHLNRLTSINFANNDTVQHTVTWQVVKSGGSTIRLGVAIPVPAGSALFIPYKGLNLQDGDVLSALADSANKIEAFVSYDDLY